MRPMTSKIILAIALILPVAAASAETGAARTRPAPGAAQPSPDTPPILLAFSDQPQSMSDGGAEDGDTPQTDQAAPATDEDSEPGDGMATPEDQALFDAWYKENDICRGHSGDDEETFKHCDARDAITEKLHARNWCYGHDGQAEYQREWEGCE